MKSMPCHWYGLSVDVRQLRYLVAVADAGSFTAGAKRAFVSQPTLSQAIAALENELGVVLFHALNQGVVNVVLGLWLWGSAVAILGASIAQRFPPLLPVVGTLAAIPILGEWPGPLQTLGVLLIVSGLALAAFGDRLFRRAPLPATQP